MPEYIDRERLKAAIKEDATNCLQSWDSGFASLVMAEIEEIPTEDVAPVVHGRWIFNSGVNYRWECSECSRPAPYATAYGATQERTPYCPSCGVKMDGRKNEEVSENV